MNIESIYEEIWQVLFSSCSESFVKKMEAENVPFEWIDQKLDELKAFSRNRRNKELESVTEPLAASVIDRRVRRIFDQEVYPLINEKEALLRKETAERPENAQ
ncbi:hypothetical protein [Enterococcus casseliflavus]|uniref:hypothetical protein n=1 Tax=Enterococcus casseliflavus TaxID=37734 RepID=UPI0022E68B3C|nr:hypothetical protein [Enterococcus casseliflavus]